MKSLIGLFFVSGLLISTLGEAATRTVWECKFWKSHRTLVRANILEREDGALKASFNYGSPINVNALSTAVQALAGGRDLLVFRSISPSDSIKELRLLINQSRIVVTTSPKGVDFAGFPGKLSVIHVNVNNRSGLSKLETPIVCRAN